MTLPVRSNSTPISPVRSSAPAPGYRKSLLWLVAIGFFMQTLDATIINTALPAMAASLGESPLRMLWVVVAYALTMAMLIPASGLIADRFGTRRVFFSAILLFVLGAEAPTAATSDQRPAQATRHDAAWVHQQVQARQASSQAG